MLLSIYLILIFLSILKPKNKIIFLCLLVLIWYLASFCTSCADRNIYLTRYNNYSYLSNYTEVGFTFLMYVFNLFKIRFDLYLMIIYAFIFGIYGWFIKKNTSRPAFVLAMYSIFSYCIDAVQIRNSLGFAFALIGINEFLKPQMNRINYIKFIGFVLLGSTIHFSVIFFLLLLLGNQLSVRKNIIATSIASVCIFLLEKTSFIRLFGYTVIGSRIDEILGRVNDYSNHRINSIIITMLLSFVIIIFITYISYENNRIAAHLNYSVGKENEIFIRKVINSQTILLITTPMIPLMPDIYRIQRYGLILGYLACSRFKVSGCHRKIINYYFYNTIFIVAVITLFYLQIYKLGNFQSTFLALFMNNRYL